MSTEDQLILRLSPNPSAQSIYDNSSEHLQLEIDSEQDDDDSEDTTLRLAGSKRTFWRKMFG